MIEGVKVKRLVRHPDDRGFFREILRDGDRLLERFGQASMSKTHPGVIKAFHYHEHQDDAWFFPVGNAQVVLYDLREASPTHGETNVFYMGEDNPIVLLIPRGVAHGYRTLGEKPAVLIYFTTEAYNRDNPDEKRLPYDEPRIGFDWSTRVRGVVAKIVEFEGGGPSNPHDITGVHQRREVTATDGVVPRTGHHGNHLARNSGEPGRRNPRATDG